MADTKAASHITDHAFVPSGEWWTRCGHTTYGNGKHPDPRVCGLAEAAHRDTTLSAGQRG